jgi:hypothetical protein
MLTLQTINNDTGTIFLLNSLDNPMRGMPVALYDLCLRLRPYLVKEIDMSESRTTPAGDRWSIARYGAAAVAATAGLAAATATEAAIIYTNPEPNIVATPNGTPADLNMDNAGPAEYSFSSSTFIFPAPGFSADLVAAPGNSFVGHTEKPFPVPKPVAVVDPLTPGTTIPGGQNFLSGAGSFRGAVVVFDFGDWVGQTAFAGLEFLLGPNTHFGWAQFQVTEGIDGASVTLFDYAYCDEPNRSIDAGQTSGACGALVGVPEPSSLLLLAGGAIGVAALRRRRRGKNAA